MADSIRSLRESELSLLFTGRRELRNGERVYLAFVHVDSFRIKC